MRHAFRLGDPPPRFEIKCVHCDIGAADIEGRIEHDLRAMRERRDVHHARLAVEPQIRMNKSPVTATEQHVGRIHRALSPPCGAAGKTHQRHMRVLIKRDVVVRFRGGRH